MLMHVMLWRSVRVQAVTGASNMGTSVKDTAISSEARRGLGGGRGDAEGGRERTGAAGCGRAGSSFPGEEGVVSRAVAWATRAAAQATNATAGSKKKASPAPALVLISVWCD